MNLPSPPPSQLPRWLRYLLILCGVVAVVVFAASFLKPSVKPVTAVAPVPVRVPDEYKRGEELSKVVCSSCHLYPPPDLLDKTTWAMAILPAMADKLGFHEVPYEQLFLQQRVIDAKIIPERPIMKIEDWRAICTYYLGAAPLATAEPQAPAQVEVKLDQFEVVQPEFRSLGFTTLTKIDSVNHRIYYGESVTNDLVVLDPRGRKLSHVDLPSPPASLEIRSNGMYVTLMGSYRPSDELEGELVWLPDRKAKNAQAREILKALPRPVKTLFADLNGDGREDLVVCGFGNLLGHFSWFENHGTNYEEHVLLDRPGAIAAEVYDFNHDGKPDIIVMMAQAREGIYIFYNQGHGEFSAPVPVVEHHPAWGSSSFELVDFNHDGFMDILATNGDEGDHPNYVPPYKSFHGIRLYLNDGKNNFKESWFYPMAGAYKAMARDFSGTGTLDIAAISFYPHYQRNAYDSFLYLKNLGNMQFKAYSFPEALSGRWITMDVGDLYGDGHLDIVLGSMQDGPSLVPYGLHEKWKKAGPSLLILKNTLHPSVPAPFYR